MDRPAGAAVMLVSGEPSGDRIAAQVARALAVRGVSCFGMGGQACAAAGVTLTERVQHPSMGLSDVVAQLPRALRALHSLGREAARRRPAAAVLVDYTEFNALLGRRLRAAGVRVLWCVAPQVWAWRPGRARALTSAFDRLAVILPFECRLWRAVGADVHYVGHPALDAPPAGAAARALARARLGVPTDRAAVAILPGSRPHEVRRHLPTMLAGVRELARERPLHLRLLLAGGLDATTRAWAARQVDGSECLAVGAGEGAGPALLAYDAAVVASGTATLESALAGTPPVIVYRASPVTAWAARRLLRVTHVGLPNLLLDDRPYPELLQDDLSAGTVAGALRDVLDHLPANGERPALLRARLSVGAAAVEGERGAAGQTAGERVAGLLDDWLDQPRPSVASVAAIASVASATADL